MGLRDETILRLCQLLNDRKLCFLQPESPRNKVRRKPSKQLAGSDRQFKIASLFDPLITFSIKNSFVVMGKTITSLNERTTLISRRVLGALAMGTVLTACGGGGNDDESLTAPVITQEPQDAAAREGESARFAVGLEQERGATYQWLKNGVAIAGANDKQLVLAPVAKADDQALFRVVITNSAGSTQSRRAVLKVQANSTVTGEVVPSRWSETLPSTDLTAGDLNTNYVAVGASGFVYFLNQSLSGLDQYKPDGTLVRQVLLPLPPAGFRGYIEQTAVVEDPLTNDIFVALGRSTGSGNVNSKLAAGGLVARYAAQSSQILFESDTVTPGGLARDQDGRLYFMDLKTGNLMRMGPSGENVEVLYRAEGNPEAKPSLDFTWFVRGTVAVAGDGTVYAKLEGTQHPALVSYPRNSVLRWRNRKVDFVDLVARLPVSASSFYFVGVGLGAYDGNVFAFVRTQENTLVRMLNADGTVSTVAGTPNSQQATQFGSPGVLVKGSRWLGITPDGRVHLQSGSKDSRMFYDVQLRSENQGDSE